MKISTMLCTAAALGMGAAVAPAADVNVQAPGTSVQVDTNRNHADADHRSRTHGDQHAGADSYSDSVTSKQVVRASEVMGEAVYNAKEEQIGTINDVVLDTQTGDVKYVALSTGGFLGLGDELHAVPWKAMSCEHRDGDRYLTLNVTNEQLEDADGFDQNNWPDMANKKWQQSNDRQYMSGQQHGNQRRPMTTNR